MKDFEIMGYTVKKCGNYYKVYDENDKDVTRKFNYNETKIIKDELEEVVYNIRASFVKDWYRITNKEICKLLKWSYPLDDEDIVYMNEDGNECIRFYIDCCNKIYIDLDVRNIRDLEILKNIYKEGINCIRKRVRYHDRYVIEKVLNSICENVSIESLTYFLVWLFDNDRDFFQIEWCRRDEDLFVEYIDVYYGSKDYTYEYKENENDIDIEKKVIEFRDFILNII